MLDQEDLNKEYHILRDMLSHLKSIFYNPQLFKNDSAVDRALMKMNEATDPLILRFSDVLDQRIDLGIKHFLSFWSVFNKKMDLFKSVARTKVRRLGYAYSGNIFNHFSYQWFVFHLPFKIAPITQYDVFARAFPASIRQNPRFERYLNHFYQSAVQVWEKMTNPTTEDVRFSLLEIVAKSINKNLSLERETFGRALYDIMMILLKKGEELTTEENFIKLMKNYMGVLWKDEKEYTRACREFFHFSRHFLTIDFPANKRNNYLLKMNQAIQNKVARLHNKTLFLLEKKVEAFYSKYVDSRISEHDFTTGISTAPLNANVRLRAVFHKLGAVMREIARLNLGRVESSRLGVNFKRNFVDNRVIKSCLEAIWILNRKSYNLIKENVLVPTWDKIRIVYGSGKSSISVFLDDIRKIDLKKILPALQKRIFYLKDSMISFYEGGVEIRFSRQSFGRYSNKLRADMAYICSEMRKCDIHTLSISFKTRGAQLYEKALESMKARRRGKSPEWHIHEDLDSSRGVFTDEEPPQYNNDSHDELVMKAKKL